MNPASPIIGSVNALAPKRFCDVVMKGGITSGVVYPLAVARLAEKFKLKNIGGTSAGAIAAAAAAAAELGRNTGGFDRLKGLPGILRSRSPDGKRTTLFAFFQPQPGTRALFNIAVAALDGCWCRMFQALVSEFWGAMLVGAIPGLLFLVFAWFNASPGFFAVCAVFASILLLVGILTSILAIIICCSIPALPDNFYGLCTGMRDEFYDPDNSPPKSLQPKPLTPWLTDYLNDLAGLKPKDKLLTFGDLWGTEAEHKINLEMMTTCLTHGRPYRLPFRDDKDLNENQFYFHIAEFKRLFPKRVVDWLVEEKHQREPSGKSQKERDESVAHRKQLAERGFYPMPAPAHLPVVVAVRMSLSFPILLSAIPLYAIERRRDSKGETPQCCWFSDGGVCSNFPLHFFDSALPRRPTLSINLSEKPDGTPCDELIPEIADNNDGGRQERWNRFEVVETIEAGTLVAREKSGLGKIGGFIGSLIKTMQNWTDNTQSRLPGFRDRIVHVPLTPNEGGLNLNMPQKRIDNLTMRGEQAGTQLLDHFSEPPVHTKMTWDNHRWLRMRSMMASLEKLLNQADNACQNPEGDDVPYDKWIESGTNPPAYDWENQEQRRLAAMTLSNFRGLAREWREAKTTKGNPVSAADGAPRPRSELRPRAQI